MTDDHRASNNSNWRRRPTQPTQEQQQQGSNQQRQGDNHGYAPMQHVPVGGFNSSEVEDYLNRGYATALEQARNSERGEIPKTKVTIYQTDQKGWSTSSKGTAWGQRAHLTAKGTAILSDLRRGLQNLQD
ncbi:hypothetical protein V1525DRAFT_399841 [Lipomyces kononenkoae]|uniref:Uncharacterized protein n=1 Tax=Lipomyces kononenkoae TaxID=34357 RepID=A0ACC3T5E0_LIPKO